MAESPDSSQRGPVLEGLSFLTVKTRALKGRADITIFVPESARPLRNVPLVIFLHGAHGSHWNWSVNGGAHRTAQRLISAGRLPPAGAGHAFGWIMGRRQRLFDSPESGLREVDC